MSMQLEGDFQSVVEVDAVDTRFLQGAQIELVGDLPMREKPQQVLFDFDGTLSLIREGWPGVMIPMMVEVLKEAGTEESDEALPVRDMLSLKASTIDRAADLNE